MDAQNFAFWPVSLEAADVLGHRSGASRRLFPLTPIWMLPCPSEEVRGRSGANGFQCDLSSRGVPLRGRTDGMHRRLVPVASVLRTCGYTPRVTDPRDGLSIP